MRTYAKIAVALIGFAMLAALLISSRKSKEPVVQGRSLSRWLEDYYSVTHAAAGGAFTPIPAELQAEMLAAESAVRELGTNAFPWLIEWVTYQTPNWRKRSYSAIQQLPRPATQRLRRFIADEQKTWLAAIAPGGFRILRDQTAAIVPQLASLLSDPKYAEAKRQIARALAGCDTNGIPALLDALSQTNRGNRRAILAGLYDMAYLGSNASAAIPALINCATDPDPMLASRAIQTMAHLGIEFETIFPTLTNVLSASDAEVRFWAVRALGGSPPNQSPHVHTALTGTLCDPDSHVRFEATNALEKIMARERATNPPPH